MRPKSCYVISSSVYRIRILDGRHDASKEFYKMCTDDPVLFEIFRECYRETVRKYAQSEIDDYSANENESLRMKAFTGIEDYYGRWSKLLGRGSFETDNDLQTMQSNCDILKVEFE